MTSGHYVTAQEQKERFGLASGVIMDVGHILAPVVEADEPGIEVRRSCHALTAVLELIREQRVVQTGAKKPHLDNAFYLFWTART